MSSFRNKELKQKVYQNFTMRKLQVTELGRKSVEEFKLAEKTPFVFVLDNVRSANNVGSVFRTADGFASTAIYLCGITAKPPSRDIHKTALGATESVMWKYFDNTLQALEELRQEGYQIISVEQATDSVSIFDLEIRKGEKYAFVFGNEVKGVEQAVIDQSDACLEIPQYGTKHSFNVAVTAGIVIWETFRKWKLL